MPSRSKAQHNFMAAVANNPQFARRAGVPQSVGRDYMKADKGREFEGGGRVMPSKYNSTANKPGKAVKKYRGGGRTAADTAANRQLSFPQALTRAARTRGLYPFNTGGKVRGCGIARQGVRPVKMVKMG